MGNEDADVVSEYFRLHVYEQSGVFDRHPRTPRIRLAHLMNQGLKVEIADCDRPHLVLYSM